MPFMPGMGSPTGQAGGFGMPTGSMPAGGMGIGGLPTLAPWGGTLAPPTGLQYAPPQKFSTAIASINSFLGQLKAQQDWEKDRALKEFQQDMMNLSLGIPIDYKKALRKAKKAGLNIRTDAPTQDDLSQYVQQGQDQMAPGMVATTQGQMQAGTAGTPQAQPKPSAWNRFAQSMGWQEPNVAPNSPGMMWMKMLADRAMSSQQMQDVTTSNQAKAQMILHKAMMGDPQATEMARNLGLMQPINDYSAMLQAGYSPEQIGETLMQTKLAPIANVVADYKAQMAKLDYDQQKQASEEFYKMMELWPTAPPELVKGAIASKMMGDRSAYGQIMNQLQRFPTKGALEEGRAARAEGRENARLGLEGQRVGLEGQRVNLSEREFSHRQSYDLMTEARRLAADEFDSYWKTYTQKDATTSQKNAAAKALVSVVNERAGRTVLDTEDVKKWYWPWGEPETKIKEPKGRAGLTSSEISKYVGVPTASTSQVAQPKVVGPTSAPQVSQQQQQGAPFASGVNPTASLPFWMPGMMQGLGAKGFAAYDQISTYAQQRGISKADAVKDLEGYGYRVDPSTRNRILQEALYGR